METSNLMSLVEHLEDNIDELEESLEPLLSATLTATTKKLPLLDNAKLYVLIVYSIESLLFSYLRLKGVKAKDHPVFKELTRVKQYFEKIKVAEEGCVKPRQNLSLNKDAAGRIIKHALTGNDKYDLERAEREAKEKLMTKRKLQVLEEKKNIQADADVDNSGGDSEASSDEAEDDKVEETISVPMLSDLPVGQPNKGDKGKSKNKTKGEKKGKIRKAERREKRKRQQEQVGPNPKKKKTRKNNKKQDRSPPAGR